MIVDVGHSVLAHAAHTARQYTTPTVNCASLLLTRIGMTIGTAALTRLSTAIVVHVVQPRLDAPAMPNWFTLAQYECQ